MAFVLSGFALAEPVNERLPLLLVGDSTAHLDSAAAKANVKILRIDPELNDEHILNIISGLPEFEGPLTEIEPLIRSDGTVIVASRSGTVYWVSKKR